MKSWRNLPPALLALFIVELVTTVTYTAYQLTHDMMSPSFRFDLADRGFWFAADALGIIGSLVLARRLTGLASTGFRIVAVSFGLSVALMFGWELFDAFQPHWNIETVDKLSQWSWFVVRLLQFGGVALAAAGSQRRGLAIAAVVLAVVANPPPPLAHHIYGWFVHGWKSSILLQEALRLAFLGVFAAVALAVSPEPYPAPPADAAPGFRAIAAGLWLRVIAACSFAGLMLLLMLGRPSESAFGVFRLATISVAVVNAISFLMIARGALTTLVRDMPALWATLGATANLWCFGVTLAQLPMTYRMLYGNHDDFDYGGNNLQERAQALSILAPLVAVAAIAVIATAIAGFAANRGLDQLRAEAQSKGLGFVTLMVAAVGIQGWLLPEQTSDGSAMFFLVAAAGCSLGATVLMARLCTRAADSLHAEMPLPTATLRS